MSTDFDEIFTVSSYWPWKKWLEFGPQTIMWRVTKKQTFRSMIQRWWHCSRATKV